MRFAVSVSVNMWRMLSIFDTVIDPDRSMSCVDLGISKFISEILWHFEIPCIHTDWSDWGVWSLHLWYIFDCLRLRTLQFLSSTLSISVLLTLSLRDGSYRSVYLVTSMPEHVWVAGGGGIFSKVVVTFSHVGGNVRIIPSFRICGYMLHAEHVLCVITNYGQHRWDIPSILSLEYYTSWFLIRSIHLFQPQTEAKINVVEALHIEGGLPNEFSRCC